MQGDETVDRNKAGRLIDQARNLVMNMPDGAAIEPSSNNRGAMLVLPSIHGHIYIEISEMNAIDKVMQWSRINNPRQEHKD